MDGQVFAGHFEGNYILKLKGRISFAQSASLEVANNEIFQADELDNVFLDLTETDALDSTALGLVAQLAVGLQRKLHHKVTIIISSDDISYCLEKVGFDKIFLILDKNPEQAFRYSEIKAEDQNEADLATRILKAHRSLMQLNEQNRWEFCDVVKSFEVDLAEAKEKRKGIPPDQLH